MPVTNFDSLTLSTPLSAANIASGSNTSHLQAFIAGAQTTGAGKWQWVVPSAATITDVRAYLGTAPTGSTFIVDILLNGVTIFTTQANRPTIAISAFASSTTLPDIVALAAGDVLTLSVSQIGATVAGSNLTASVTIKRANVA